MSSDPSAQQPPRMTVTPVRGLIRPERKPASFRLATDIPDVIRSIQAAYSANGRRVTRDEAVDIALRELAQRLTEPEQS